MNPENVQRVIDKIEANPACWDQTQWHCGSTHCLFGLAQIMSGKPENSNTVRRDARIFLGMTMDEANYFASPNRTLWDFKQALINRDKRIYDEAGYDQDGFDANGFNRDGFDHYELDWAGYNASGYNKDGYNRDGFDREGYDQRGYDRSGYDADSLDRMNRPKGDNI